jgi:hypothetical protein
MLSASAVAESVFCPRAAILTLESQVEERIEDPAFDVTAIYELRILEAAIVRSFWLVTASIVGVIALYVATKMMMNRGYWLVWLLALPFGVRLLVFSCSEIATLVSLLAKKNVANKAHCAEPDVNSLEMQNVTWWGLLNLGFESVASNQAMQDSEWKLSGKPWRVLRRGSLRIPAFRTKSNSAMPSQQSIAKIMAYCHLLESQEGFDSPYGIVLMGDSYRGFAVPNRGTFPRIFHNALLELRKVVAGVKDQGSDPSSPTEKRKCSDCPFGKPRLVTLRRPTTQDGHELKPHILQRWRERFHCDCGDRFRWKPPHADNARLAEKG